jgi:dTDP-4-amino-4,6-dideoxygalactose transaminase
VIKLEDKSMRDNLRDYLHSKGIECGIHYPIPIHLMEAFKFLGYQEGDFPITEECSRTILSLPMYPELKESEIKYIVEEIKRFFK